MPWYYAGPEAKPVGPLTLDELHSARLLGALTPDTYVLEHSAEPGSAGTWRHYREVFPETASLPPVPGGIPAPPPLNPSSAAHPLFSSSTPASYPAAYPQASPHGHYPIRRTNAWCGWGFGLGVAGFVFSFGCVGLLLSAPALVICILGFSQVQRHPEQSGRGLAIAGGVLSLLGLLISLAIMVWSIPVAIKAYERAATQQSSD